MKLSSSTHYALLFWSAIAGLTNAASDHNSHLNDDTPCVARSPTTGLYFDLNAISLSPPETKNGKKVDKDAREESWHARGHDYPANFTINICAPVIEDVKDVVGIEASRWKNVSAYYKQAGKIYSIGYDIHTEVPGASFPYGNLLWTGDGSKPFHLLTVSPAFQ